MNYLDIAHDLKQALAFYSDFGGRGDPSETQEQAVSTETVLQQAEWIANELTGLKAAFALQSASSYSIMKQFKRVIEMLEHITIIAGTLLMRSPPGRISLTSLAGRRLVREAFQMKRNMAYRRWQRNRVINRKVRILKRIGGDGQVFAWSRGDTGRFAKGKIHCSCWMCRTKSYDYFSHADEKRILATRQQQVEQDRGV